MANQKTREKRKQRRQRKSEYATKAQDPEEELDDEGDLPEDEPLNDDERELLEELDGATDKEVKGIVQKDYGMPGMQSPMGPTSFEELDAIEAAQERADEVRELTWNVQDLVRNITCSPIMNPDDQAKAIQNVGDGFGKRVKQILSASPDTMKKDMDLLELEALIAIDQRNTPMTEKVGDWLTKAKLSSQARNNLSSDEFALPEKRKYPIMDKAHVRNALARAAQQIKAGGSGASDARAALPKIRAAAKKMGIGMQNMSKGLIVEKDASGNWRAVMWPTNNFKDLDGDIISEAAHEEYVDWVNKNMDAAPVFISWHTPGTRREAQIDYATYEKGFVLMSSPLTEDEARVLLEIQKEVDLGMSHGTFVLERNAKDLHIVEKYRMIEVSELPLDRAANPFTDFEIVSKESNMDKVTYLAGILGSVEKAKAYLEKAGIKQDGLREAGVKEAEASAAEEKQETSPAPVTATTDQAAIIEAITKAMDLDGLNEFLTSAKESMDKVAVLEGLVKELSTNREDALAEMIEPKASRYIWMNRASTAEDNVVEKGSDEDKALTKKARTNLGWLSEATGTEPVEIETVGGA